MSSVLTCRYQQVLRKAKHVNETRTLRKLFHYFGSTLFCRLHCRGMMVWQQYFFTFLPARCYASAGLCDSDVSVRLSVCPSHASIVPSRAKAGS